MTRDAKPTDRFAGWRDLPARSLVVDAATLAANLDRMRRIAGGAELRPHVKTHKSLLIARMQRDAGATGFTAALAEEALALLAAGLGPVTIARPVIEAAALDALIPHARAGRLRFIADCSDHLAALAAAAARAPGAGAIDVLIKVDVGLHRLGVAPEAAAVAALAREIRAPLRYAGLLSHAGQSYAGPDVAAIRAVAAEETRLMTGLARAVPAAVPAEGRATVVSVGATPTLLAGQDLTGVTEIRPGNYALLDMTAVGLGVADRDQIAMAVVATVIGLGPGRVVVDAGSKVLSSDKGAHGTAIVAGYGELWLDGARRPLVLKGLSEEHGIAAAEATTPARVGQRALILPNHACPVMNLAGGFALTSGGGAHRLGPTSADIARARLDLAAGDLPA